MMSGRLPSRIAAWDNASEWAAEVPTFAHYLSAAGYSTVLSGKMHFVGPDQLHGYEHRLTTDVYPADFNWHPSWDRPHDRLDWFHTMDVVATAGPCVRASNIDYDDEVLFRAKRCIFDHARSDGERPLMLTVSFIQPHDPYVARLEHWNRYRDEDIDMPRLGAAQAPDGPHLRRLRRTIGTDELEPTADQIRSARRAYYASISDVDDRVAELVAALEESGLDEDTVIIFTADHGDMLGERGLWFKMSFFEHSARVPLIVRAPQRFAPRRVAQSVSLVDLLPTLVELSGDGAEGRYATPLEGRSLLPHLAGDTGHDEVIGEYFGEGVESPLFMIRRGHHKFIACGSDPLQLYDLHEDVMETRNLASSDAGVEALAAFQREARSRWNAEELRDRVLESQRRRALLKRTMISQEVSWDYQPFEDASKAYIRSSLPVYEVERRSRVPRE